MPHCHSCGGVIGRDCFNPIECAQITASMEYNSQQQSNFNAKGLDSLQERFDKLVSILQSFGVNVDEVLIKHTSDNYLDADKFPF